MALDYGSESSSIPGNGERERGEKMTIEELRKGMGDRFDQLAEEMRPARDSSKSTRTFRRYGDV